MAAARLYENFSDLKIPIEEKKAAAEELSEEVRLQSFESGYSAGWEDALKAATKEEERLSDALKDTLMSLDFSKQEISVALVDAVTPLIDAIFSKLVPEVAEIALHTRIAGLVNQQVEPALDLQPELRLNPVDCQAARLVINRLLDSEISISANADVSPGQALLCLSDANDLIDLPRLVDDVQALVSAHLETLKEGKSHG